MQQNEFITLQDDDISMNLESLASVIYISPEFRALTDFSIISLLFHGNMSSLFTGMLDNKPVIIETCNRIPFRLVCREIKLLKDLHIDGIVKFAGCTKNSSLGIVSIAYESFQVQSWTQPIQYDELVPLFYKLLSILSQLHQNKISHSWICRSSIYISPDHKSLTLGSFHAASKPGEPAPFVPNHPCAPKERHRENPMTDDIYSAALWFLSYLTPDPNKILDNLGSIGINNKISRLLTKMINPDGDKRITADKAVRKLRKLMHGNK